MKRQRKLLILAVILVLVCGGIAAAKLYQKHQDKISTTDEEVMTVKADDLTEVSWLINGDEFDFVKTDGTWQDSSDADFPVDQDKMADFLAKFDSVHASFIINDVEDYGQYGLDDPECTVTFTTADGEQNISFGSFSKMDEKRYIKCDDGNVYLIDDDLEEYVPTDRDDLMKKDEMPSYSQLTSLQMTGDNELDISYEPDADYSYTSDYNYYLNDGDSHKALSDTNMDVLLSKITGLSLDDYVTYTADDAALAEYGLDDPTLTISMSGETSEEDDDGNPVTKDVTLKFSKVDDDTVYMQFDGSSIVYQVDADTYDQLVDEDYDSLRPVAMVVVDWTNVNQIEFKSGDDDFTVDVTHKNGNTYKSDDETVEFDDATSDIDNLNVSELPDDAEKGQLELSITIKQDDEDYPELTLEFYRYDGDDCIADFNGETVGLVDRSAMSNLREAMTSAVLNKGKEEE